MSDSFLSRIEALSGKFNNTNIVCRLAIGSETSSAIEFSSLQVLTTHQLYWEGKHVIALRILARNETPEECLVTLEEGLSLSGAFFRDASEPDNAYATPKTMLQVQADGSLKKMPFDEQKVLEFLSTGIPAPIARIGVIDYERI